MQSSGYSGYGHPIVAPPVQGQLDTHQDYLGMAPAMSISTLQTSQTPEEAAHAAACAVDHAHTHFNYEDLFCCDLPCPDMSFCDPHCDPDMFPEMHKQPITCCSPDVFDASYADCSLPHEPCPLPAQAHSPCEDPSCGEPAEADCCEDPYCEDVSACCPLPCAEQPPSQHQQLQQHQQHHQHQHHPPDECTTCCMSDICPHPSHNHTAGVHDHFPTGHTAWHGQMHPPHLSMAQCASGLSTESLLSAALRHDSVESSPITSGARSTRASTVSSMHEPSHRGGHRRLQGATALQVDGKYLCHWNHGTHICNKFFTSAQDLHHHVQSAHFVGSGSNHPCQWNGCDSGVFNTKPKLSRHLHSHTEWKPHQCDYPGCSLTFVTQQQRDVHRKKHTGEKPFECTVCGKAFAYRDLLKSHMRSGVHGEADKKFTCTICGEGFSDSSNRTKHTKSVHDPATGVPCPEGPACPYVDTRREKLRQHCLGAGHGLEIVRDPRKWEEYFNREQMLRKPIRGMKRKRASVDVGGMVIPA
jgi:hypothetical protein